jgi:hypothetical protein
MIGRWATAGELVYANSHGKFSGHKNAFYTTVIELSDCPASLRRVIVNGEYVSLGQTAHPQYGFPVTKYRQDGKDHLWIKFYNGTQTAADPYLVSTYGSDPDIPYDSDMIGLGIAYAIVTAGWNPKLHRGVPQCKFELNGMRMYDPRFDSSVGGSGSQRYNNPATWSALGSTSNENNAVVCYNIILGLKDPITGDHLFGGKEVTQAMINQHLADWFVAMNECDATATGEGGPEKQYTCGYEIVLDDNTVPVDVMEDILSGCQGQIAAISNSFTIHIGAPGAPVYAFGEDDIVMTLPEDFEPIVGIDQKFSGISARYPEPADLWEMRDSPVLNSATYEQKDGRKTIANVIYPSVWNKSQVQRLNKAGLLDQRRERRHNLVLFPEGRALAPLDVIEYTSERHGYDAKNFVVDLVEHLPNGGTAVALREVDPNDYDFEAEDLLPTSVGFVGRPPSLLTPADFSVFAGYEKDTDDIFRRPTIELHWDPNTEGVFGVRWQLRLAADPTHQPNQGSLIVEDDDINASELTIAGEPLNAFPGGNSLITGYSSAINRGILVIRNVLADEDYEVIARFDPRGAWSGWMPVHTLDVRLSLDDFNDAVAGQIQDAQDKANQAVADLISVSNQASQALSVAQQALQATGVAGKFLAGGWLADPSFNNWTDDDLDDWTEVGGANIVFTSNGFFNNSAADIAAPADTATSVSASKGNNQTSGLEDLAVEYLVLAAMIQYVSGTISGGTLEIEWLIGGNWTPGEWPINEGVTDGNLEGLGFRATTGVKQLIQTLVQKPAGTATDVRVTLTVGSSGGPALRIIAHSIDVGVATSEQIAIIDNRNYIDAEIEEVNLTITALDAAYTAQFSTLTSSVNGLTAEVSDQAAALVTLDEATAARFIRAEVAFDPLNFVRNPDFVDDVASGDLAVGVSPLHWTIPTSWRVRKRTGSTAPISSSPANGMMEMPVHATLARTMFNIGFIPVRPNEQYYVAFNHAVTVGGSASLDFQVRYFDAAKAPIAGDSIQNHLVTSTSTTWTQYVSPVVGIPGGTAYIQVHFSRAAGGAGTAYATMFTGRRLEPALEQALTAAVVLTANAGNPAELSLVSWTRNGFAQSLARIDADNILISGTVLMEHLLVHEWDNKVADNQTYREWALGTGWSLVVPEPQASLKSANSIQYNDLPGTGYSAFTVSPKFKVSPDTEYTVEYTFRRGGTVGQAQVLGRLWWVDANGTVTLQNLNEQKPPSQATVTINVTSPSTAVFAQILFYVNRNETTAATVRIGGVSMRRVINGVVEIQDGTVTAVKILADDAFFNKLTARAAWIGSLNVANLQIGNQHIQDFAVSRQAWTFVEALSPIQRDTWVNILALAITRRAGKNAFLFYSESWDRGASSGPRHRLRFVRDSTVFKTFQFERDDTKGQTTKIYADTANVTGTVTYIVQVFIEDGSGMGDFRLDDLSFYIHEISK